jgi:hypothetical protein
MIPILYQIWGSLRVLGADSDGLRFRKVPESGEISPQGSGVWRDSRRGVLGILHYILRSRVGCSAFSIIYYGPSGILHYILRTFRHSPLYITDLPVFSIIYYGPSGILHYILRTFRHSPLYITDFPAFSIIYYGPSGILHYILRSRAERAEGEQETLYYV